MIDLCLSDYRAIHEAALILHGGHTDSAFTARLEKALAVLIQADVLAAECFNAEKTWIRRLFADPAALVEKLFPAFLRSSASHPLFPVFADNKLTQPLRTSDVISCCRLRDLSIYAEFLKPLGADRQMAVAIPRRDGSEAVLVFSRQRFDFTNHERARLSAFLPHIVSAQTVSELLCNDHSATLRRTVTSITTTLPLIKTSLGITAREAEIVHWLANGKSDIEIGMICRISKRTVQKHCENIYRKMGVECRTATVVRALERCMQTTA